MGLILYYRGTDCIVRETKGVYSIRTSVICTRFFSQLQVMHRLYFRGPKCLEYSWLRRRKNCRWKKKQNLRGAQRLARRNRSFCSKPITRIRYRPPDHMGLDGKCLGGKRNYGFLSGADNWDGLRRVLASGGPQREGGLFSDRQRRCSP